MSKEQYEFTFGALLDKLEILSGQMVELEQKNTILEEELDRVNKILNTK